MKTIDLIFEILSLIGLGLIIYLVIITYPELPDKIPKHWNYKGIADRWGDRGNFLTLPIVTFIIYGVFSLVSMNRLNTYKLIASVGEIKAGQIILLIGIFKTVLIGLILLDIYGQSMNYLGKEPIIGGVGVLMKIILIFAFILLMSSTIFRNKK